MDNKQNKLKIILTGALIGLINGIFGGGGGMIAVPALTFLLGLKAHSAHATAIFVIFPITILSAFIYALKVPLDRNLVVPVVLGVFFGGILGAKAMPKLSGKSLTILFCAIMFAAGIKMVI